MLRRDRQLAEPTFAGAPARPTRSEVAHCMFDSLRQDVTGAMRGLIKSPGFAAASLITLALGIGATSAIFSVVKAVLITPLPYAAARTARADLEPLDQLRQDVARRSGGRRLPQHVEDADRDRRLEHRAAEPDRRRRAGARRRRLRHRQHVRRARRARRCSAASSPPRKTCRTARRSRCSAIRSGSRATAAIRTSSAGRCMINDVPVEVIGVMPEGFRLPTDFTDEAAEPTQLWRPLQIDEPHARARNHGYYAAAMLAPGQTAASATDELRAITDAAHRAGRSIRRRCSSRRSPCRSTTRSAAACGRRCGC